MSDQIPPQAPTPPDPTQQAAPGWPAANAPAPRRRRRWLIPALAAAVVLVLGLSAALLLPRLFGAAESGGALQPYPQQPTVAWTISTADILGEEGLAAASENGGPSGPPVVYSRGQLDDGTFLVGAWQQSGFWAAGAIVGVDPDGEIVWRGPRYEVVLGYGRVPLAAECTTGHGRIACVTFPDDGADLYSILILDERSGSQVERIDVPYDIFADAYDVGEFAPMAVPLEDGVAVVFPISQGAATVARLDSSGVQWSADIENNHMVGGAFDIRVRDGEIRVAPFDGVLSPLGVPWVFDADTGEAVSEPVEGEIVLLADDGVVRSSEDSDDLEVVTADGGASVPMHSGTGLAPLLRFDQVRGPITSLEGFVVVDTDGERDVATVYDTQNIENPVVLDDTISSSDLEPVSTVVRGAGSPVIVRIRDEIRAYDAETGMRLWTGLTRAISEEAIGSDGSTGIDFLWIADDGERVIAPAAATGTAGITAFSVADGQEQWTLELPGFDPAAFEIGRAGEFLTVTDTSGQLALIEP
ncbi:PQQ-binding-like beta-propeller repeat protein [Ruania rhizosphaerae]|uniref:PQQ-binding-like beta-propeller repeat protein n=1 Tax=Ruania rhizosphaerae TaxID=1840413 RepID=UPI00135A3FF4|nr:PQQ-binding-like beta-propeller repeat protein [Ruania rhizosphaerae]